MRSYSNSRMHCLKYQVKTDRVMMSIDVRDAMPICQAPNKLPDIIKDQVGRKIDSLEKAGITVKSQSPWSSPVVPVKKPDGSVTLH